MNIQIYGKPKCFDTKKAERYFKERRIKFQYIDLSRNLMSPGEYRNIKTACRGEELVDEKAKGYEGSFIKYLADAEAVEEKLMEDQTLFRTPIVRNGKKATVGYKPEIWKEWE